LNTPNAETRVAMEEARTMIEKHHTRFNSGASLIEKLDEETCK